MARAWPRVPLPPVGVRVSVSGLYSSAGADGLARGTVKFAGRVAFAEGDWVGVDLDDPVGRHQGSVNGKQYFDLHPTHAEAAHGVFVRPEEVRLLDEEPECVDEPVDDPLCSPDGSPTSTAFTRSATQGSRSIGAGAPRQLTYQRLPSAGGILASTGGASAATPLGRGLTSRADDDVDALVADLWARLDAEERQRFALQERLQVEEKYRQDLQEALSSAWSALLHTKKTLKESEAEYQASLSEFRSMRNAEQRALDAAKAELRACQKELSQTRARLSVQVAKQEKDEVKLTAQKSVVGQTPEPSQGRRTTNMVVRRAPAELQLPALKPSAVSSVNAPVVLGDEVHYDSARGVKDAAGVSFRVAVWDLEKQANILEFFPRIENCKQDLRRVVEIADLVLRDPAIPTTLEEMVLELYPEGPLSCARDFELAPLRVVPKGLPKWLADREGQWPERLRGKSAAEAALAWCDSAELRWDFWKKQRPMDWLSDDGSGSSATDDAARRTMRSMCPELTLVAAEQQFKEHGVLECRSGRSKFYLWGEESAAIQKAPPTGTHDYFKLVVWDILMEYIVNLAVDEQGPEDQRRNVEDVLTVFAPSFAPSANGLLREDRLNSIGAELQRQADMAILLRAADDGDKAWPDDFWVVSSQQGKRGRAGPAILLRKGTFEEPVRLLGLLEERLVGCTTKRDGKVLTIIAAQLPSVGPHVQELARVLERFAEPSSMLCGCFDEEWSSTGSSVPEHWRQASANCPRLKSLLDRFSGLSASNAEADVVYSPFQVRGALISRRRRSLNGFMLLGELLSGPGGRACSFKREFLRSHPFEHAVLSATCILNDQLGLRSLGDASPKVQARLEALQIPRSGSPTRPGSPTGGGLARQEPPAAEHKPPRSERLQLEFPGAENDWHLSSDDEVQSPPPRLSPRGFGLGVKHPAQDVTDLTKMYKALSSEIQHMRETQALLLQAVGQKDASGAVAEAPFGAVELAGSTQRMSDADELLARSRLDATPEFRPALHYKPLVVGIIGARGLVNTDSGQGSLSDPYCLCQVPDRPSTRIKTKSLRDTLEPLWKHADEILEYCEGDSLLFEVYDKDSLNQDADDFLGRALLSADHIIHGFDGELALDTGREGTQSFLRIMVKPKLSSALLAYAQEPCFDAQGGALGIAAQTLDAGGEARIVGRMSAQGPLLGEPGGRSSDRRLGTHDASQAMLNRSSLPRSST